MYSKTSLFFTLFLVISIASLGNTDNSGNNQNSGKNGNSGNNGNSNNSGNNNNGPQCNDYQEEYCCSKYHFSSV